MAASWYKQKQKQKSVNVCTVCSRKHCLQLSQALGWVFFLMPIHSFSTKFKQKQGANFQAFKSGQRNAIALLTSATCSGVLFLFFFCHPHSPLLPSCLHFCGKVAYANALACIWFLFFETYISGQITALIIQTPENLLENTLLLTYNLFIKLLCKSHGDEFGILSEMNKFR